MIVVVAFRHAFGLQTMEHFQKPAKIDQPIQPVCRELRSYCARHYPDRAHFYNNMIEIKLVPAIVEHFQKTAKMDQPIQPVCREL